MGITLGRGDPTLLSSTNGCPICWEPRLACTSTIGKTSPVDATALTTGSLIGFVRRLISAGAGGGAGGPASARPIATRSDAESSTMVAFRTRRRFGFGFDAPGIGAGGGSGGSAS